MPAQLFKMISNANSAEVKNKFIFILLTRSYLDGQNQMTDDHCMRDHGTDNESNFDSEA